MGLGRIPWYEVVRYAEYEGFDEEETEFAIELIERLDLEEHKIQADELKNNRKTGDGTESTARDRG